MSGCGVPPGIGRRRFVAHAHGHPVEQAEIDGGDVPLEQAAVFDRAWSSELSASATLSSGSMMSSAGGELQRPTPVADPDRGHELLLEIVIEGLSCLDNSAAFFAAPSPTTRGRLGIGFAQGGREHHAFGIDHVGLALVCQTANGVALLDDDLERRGQTAA